MSGASAVEPVGVVRREKSIWRNPIAIWALVLGVIAHLAGFFAFNLELPSEQVMAPPAPEIYYLGANDELNDLMQEQSDLLDFEPLFLPTSRNASVYLGWEQLVERTQPFTELPPRLLISEERFPEVGRDKVAPLSDPPEMLERDAAGSFGAFGQLVDAQTALPARGGSVEVYREGKSQVVLEKELIGGVFEEAADNLSGVQEWGLKIGDTGVVGEPLLIRGSGLESVDAAAAKYLDENIPQWSLAPGYYRVVIGP
ncbi:hypothetical protein [Cerasicoccus maritimus]|uniref:hypothetical protein n=1 Tax=Cerasicoccus maritimus TaxID=490089 RepID=UPI00285282AE|nr:hypothetical protein [Cerasicoccus maritimus]